MRDRALLHRVAKAALPTIVAAATLAAPLAGAAHAKAHLGTTRTRDGVSRLERNRTRCEREFRERLRALHRAANNVTNSDWLTDDHKAALAASLETDAATLDALAAAIHNAATLDDLRAACRNAFEQAGLARFDMRKVRLTAAADRESAVVAQLQQIIDELNNALDALEAGGTDVSDLRALVIDLETVLQDDGNAVADMGDAIVALTSDDWANGTAGPELDGDHDILEDTYHSLGDIAAGLQALVDQLAGGDGGATSN